MTQHDYNIVNDRGSVVRNDINQALQAILSVNSGVAEPPVLFPGTMWFDISNQTGPGVFKIYTLDGKWETIAWGVTYLPLTGGNIVGDLTVPGVFSNPDYNKRKVSYIGGTPPYPVSTAPKGMQWFDTSNASRPQLRQFDGTAWTALVDIDSPSFTQMVDITTTATVAKVDLVAGSPAETRTIRNVATENYIDFLNAAGTRIAAFGDTAPHAGDMWVSGIGWLSDEIASKQANLGFTPIATYSTTAMEIGGNPAHLWAAGVDKGVIRLGTQVNVYRRGAVGSYSRATTIDPTVLGNGTIAAGNLRYGGDNGPGIEAGTWRNMSGRVDDADRGWFQRIV